MDWIQQTEQYASSCVPIAMLNALKYHGLPCMRYGSEEWERLVDLAKCRDGATIGERRVAKALGLKLVSIPSPLDRPPILEVPSMLPAMITCWPPGIGTHAVLVVKTASEGWDLVNYLAWRGPVRVRAKPESLKWPVPGTYMSRSIYQVLPL